ncbi:MAG: inositol monophosphatase [Proteobacteria bacterium]|jgi:myo-inositol-1(or 4)-monophosphatase|nr:inositol monophosphatase [Pseudomonadota bacterium]
MAWEAELLVAIEAAGAAAAVLHNHADGPLRVFHKGDVNLVTEVDFQCEQAITEILRQHTPDIEVLGEETGGAENATTRWVVDPLDGTTNFIHNYPMYCVSIALEVEGQSVVGVILDPIRQRTYRAIRGQGAYCGDRPLHVSKCDDVSRALIGTGFPYDRREEAHFYLAYVEAVLCQAQGIRRAGAAAMDLVMVASGVLDGFWEFNLSTWDVAAGLLLVEEAGGECSSHGGGKVNMVHPSPLATNGLIHEAMISLLGSVRA